MNTTDIPPMRRRGAGLLRYAERKQRWYGSAAVAVLAAAALQVLVDYSGWGWVALAGVAAAACVIASGYHRGMARGLRSGYQDGRYDAADEVAAAARAKAETGSGPAVWDGEDYVRGMNEAADIVRSGWLLVGNDGR